MIFRKARDATIPSIFAGKIEGQIRLLNAESGPLRRTIHAHQQRVLGCDFFEGVVMKRADLSGAVAQRHGRVLGLV